MISTSERPAAPRDARLPTLSEQPVVRSKHRPATTIAARRLLEMRGEIGARAEFEPVVLFVTAESPISQSPGTTLGTGPAIARIVRPLLQPDKLLTAPS